MSILSEIFAEMFGGISAQSQQTKPQGGNAPYGMTDPFANNTKKTTANKASKSSPKNVPIGQQKTELEMHAERQGKGKKAAPKIAEIQNETPIASKAPSFEYTSNITAKDMRKAVVMSEILGKPKCKR